MEKQKPTSRVSVYGMSALFDGMFDGMFDSARGLRTPDCAKARAARPQHRAAKHAGAGGTDWLLLHRVGGNAYPLLAIGAPRLLSTP